MPRANSQSRIIAIQDMPHDRIERRSFALHRAIAAKLRQRPELLAVAHSNIERWSRQAGGSQPYPEAWREILSQPFSRFGNWLSRTARA
jgi:hypothetical protein